MTMLQDQHDVANEAAIAAHDNSGTGLTAVEFDRAYVDFVKVERERWAAATAKRDARHALDDWLVEAKDLIWDCLVKATRNEDRKIGDNIVRMPVVDCFALANELRKAGFDQSKYAAMYSEKSPKELQIARRIWGQVRKFAKHIGQSDPKKFPDFDAKSPYMVQAMVCRMATDVGFGYDLAKIAVVKASIIDQYNALKARLSFLN